MTPEDRRPDERRPDALRPDHAPPVPPAGPAPFSPLRIGIAAVVVLALVGGAAFTIGRVRAGSSPSTPTWSAPYVDLTLTPAYPFEDPATNPSEDVVLGFVVADPDAGCTPSWGGAYSLDGAAAELDLERRIAQYRSDGGDVVASFGGAANQELALTCREVTPLATAYRSVVERYHLTTIDLDVEGPALADRPSQARRAEAVALVQRETRRAGQPLSVWLTLPVAPTGLSADGVAALDAMLAADVDLGGLNLMTMDYGASRPSTTPMADANEQALRAAHEQLDAAYDRAGDPLGDDALWARMGATPMVGVNDEVTDVFAPADARALRSLATDVGLARVSMWSANRDAPCPDGPDLEAVSNTCSGIEQTAGAYARIFGRLGGRPAVAAVEGPRKTSTSTIGEDPDPAASPHPIWASGTVYEAGDEVVGGSSVYAATWWTKGADPTEPPAEGEVSPWRRVGPVLPGDRAPVPVTVPEGTHPAWDPATAYRAGATVQRRGVAYRARWWTQGDEPGVSLDASGQTPWDAVG